MNCDNEDEERKNEGGGAAVQSQGITRVGSPRPFEMGEIEQNVCLLSQVGVQKASRDERSLIFAGEEIPGSEETPLRITQETAYGNGSSISKLAS